MSRHSSRGTKWNTTRQRILQRDNNTCAYCLGIATTIDHRIPKSKGGTDDDWNLVACCNKCNAIKGDRQLIRMTWKNKQWL